jgi:hypothetical protein
VSPWSRSAEVIFFAETSQGFGLPFWKERVRCADDGGYGKLTANSEMPEHHGQSAESGQDCWAVRNDLQNLFIDVYKE